MQAGQQRTVSFFVNGAHWKTMEMNQGDLTETMTFRSEQATEAVFAYTVFRSPQRIGDRYSRYRDHIQYVCEDDGLMVTRGSLVDVWQQ